MKSIGIVRKVDELGRIVLPIELRRTMNIDVKDSLEIYVDGNNIILRKYAPGCMFCVGSNHLQSVDGCLICPDCARKYAKRFAQVAQGD